VNIKKYLKSTIIKLSGNSIIQYILDRSFDHISYLLGIGSGDNPENSGEIELFNLLNNSNSSFPIIIFDVGANIGSFVDLAIKNINQKDFYIHSFEPSKYSFEILSNKYESNPRLILNNFGLSDKSVETTLYTNIEGSPLSSLYKRDLRSFDINFSKTEKINLITLDEYCKQHNIHNIDLLKLDIEGHELDALRGANELLKAKKIKMISFEFGGTNIDSRTFLKDFFNYFDKFNIPNIFRITPSGKLFQMYPYREKFEQFICQNILVICR